ncbi:MAG: sulfatase [Armatimonadota bacterium]
MGDTSIKSQPSRESGEGVVRRHRRLPSGQLWHGRLPSGQLWCWPLVFGLPAALVLGGWVALPEIARQAMFRFGFTRTACGLLAGTANQFTLYTAGFFALLALAVWAGRRARGRIGAVLRVALPLAVTGAAAWYLAHRNPLQAHSLRNQGMNLLESVLRGKTAADLLLHPAVLTGVLALLVLVLFARRGRLAVLAAAGRRLAFLLRAGAIAINGLLLLLAAGYAAVNLTAGYLHLQAARVLRDQPNIIFIMIDTLRADHVGCYGYDLPTTPHIDRFAAESTRFEHAVAQSSWTVWSVNSLMSSRYPERLFTAGTHARDAIGEQGVGRYYPMLAEMLRDRGYATNAVVANPWLVETPTTSQGYAFYHDAPARVMESRETAPRVTDAVLRRTQALGERPFFFFAVYMDPHEPYFQHRDFRFGPSRRDRTTGTTHSPAERALREDALRRYDSEIAYTDFHVGRLLAGLKAQGRYDNSLIVLFSDHGEEFLEHGEFSHRRTVYEEVTQVPLIIKRPKQRRGTVVRGTFPLIDLYPTLAAMLDVDAGRLGLQGQAAQLSSLLKCAEKPLYSATDEGPQCIRNGGYKYIRQLRPPLPGHGAREELYHLPSDPLEQRNLIGAEPARAKALAALLETRDDHELPADAAYRREPAAGDDGRVDALTRVLESVGYGHR